MSETLIGGGLFTAVGMVIVALVQRGNREVTKRMDRFEDKLDGHIQWHLSSCPLFDHRANSDRP